MENFETVASLVEASDDSDERLGFGYYIALFIDLLGQSAHLDKFPSPLHVEAFQDTNALEYMKTTVLNLRRICEDFMTAFQSFSAIERSLNIQGEDSVIPQYFSDSMLFYTKLFNANGQVNVNNVLSIFSAASSTLLVSLAQAIPFRGGLDIGIAANFHPVGLYGPLVKSVHYLENKCAGYPRIIVGETCRHFLRLWSEIGQTSEYATKLTVLGSTLTNDMIYHDDDGEYMIDFLGKFVHRMSTNLVGVDSRKLVGQAYHFANEQKLSFGQQRHLGGKAGKEAEKLFQRYSKLTDYIRGRKDSFWRE